MTSDHLSSLVRAARLRGHMGIAIIAHGDASKPTDMRYVAGCVSKNGAAAFCEPTWDAHPTPEAALAQLAVKLSVDPPTPAAPEPGGDV